MAKSGKDPLLGKRIREYEILESIGRGGMGAVYRARHIYLDKERAIKVVHRGLTESEDFVQRFIREAKVLSELNHPNVVHLFDFGMLDDNTFFMVMELIRGETVIERIQKLTRLPAEDAIRIVGEAARGLSLVHRKGIIHRDISPDNLILVRDDESNKEVTKVVDFGIAKPLYEDTGRFTMTNFFIGKPEYSSPEQCGTLPEGESLDQRSDIYSLGVTFFQMLTGRLPFVASTPQGYLLKHAQEDPQPPSAYLPHGDIPAAVDRLVMKMLAKRRKERHRNFEEVIAEIESISFTEGPTLASLQKETALPKQFPVFNDETLRTDQDTLRKFIAAEQDTETINTPTEPLPPQNPSEPQHTRTTPVRPAQPKKENQITLIAILSAVFICIFTVSGFFLYQFWTERNSKTNSEKSENGILLDAEKAVRAGDIEAAEELLRKAESQNLPEENERISSIRNQINAVRTERLKAKAAEHLRKSNEFVSSGKLDEASVEIDALQSLNLPEFQDEIESTKSLIENSKKKLASQQDAEELLREIELEISEKNFELSRQKLKSFKSRKFQGFENDVASLEAKIQSVEKEIELEKGRQFLNDAEKLLRQKDFESATQKINQARLLKLPDLESRIISLSAQISSLQNETNERVEKARSLLGSAQILIRVGQFRQAQQWLTQAKSIGVAELQPEIDSLTRQLRNSTGRKASGTALQDVEKALQRGDWIEAQQLLQVLRKNQAQVPVEQIRNFDQQILGLRPYVGFGVKRKWEESDSKRYGLAFGASVAKVDPGSPADRSGLKAGDAIIEYNGTILVDDSQLPWLGAYTKPGSEVLLKVIRNGNPLNIRILAESMLNNQPQRL